MRKAVLSALLFAVPLQAFAGPSQSQPVVGVANVTKWSSGGGTCSLAGSCKILNGVAATASSGDRTFNLPVQHYNVTTVQIDYTYNAGTAVTLTCTASLNGGGSYASITSTAISSGTGTVSPYNDSWAPGGASGNILLDYKTARYDNLSCIVAVTGGNSSDTFNVYAVSATE